MLVLVSCKASFKNVLLEGIVDNIGVQMSFNNIRFIQYIKFSLLKAKRIEYAKVTIY